jgi:hypothetical protein
MAYLVTNLSEHPVLLPLSSITIGVGVTRPITEIGTRELDLQRSGIINITRSPNDEQNKDDARYVELLDSGGLFTTPESVTLVNAPMPLANTWYQVSTTIPGVVGWKLQLRRSSRSVPFDYCYDIAIPTFMTCAAGEVVCFDTKFPALYVRCPKKAGQTAELEYWMKPLP